MSKIYKNAFGNPEPNVSVDIFGRCTWLNQPGYFSTSSVSDFPKIKWEIDEIGKDEMRAVADRIVNRFLEMGFRVSVRQNGYGEPVINAVHIETEKAYKNALAAQKKDFCGSAIFQNVGNHTTTAISFLNRACPCIMPCFMKTANMKLCTVMTFSYLVAFHMLAAQHIGFGAMWLELAVTENR